MEKIDAFKQKVKESLELVKSLEGEDQEQAASYLSEVLGVSVGQLKGKSGETPHKDGDEEKTEESHSTPTTSTKRGRGRPSKNVGHTAATPVISTPKASAPGTPASPYGLRGSIKPVKKPDFVVDERYAASRGTPSSTPSAKRGRGRPPKAKPLSDAKSPNSKKPKVTRPRAESSTNDDEDDDDDEYVVMFDNDDKDYKEPVKKYDRRRKKQTTDLTTSEPKKGKEDASEDGQNEKANEETSAPETSSGDSDSRSLDNTSLNIDSFKSSEKKADNEHCEKSDLDLNLDSTTEKLDAEPLRKQAEEAAPSSKESGDSESTGTTVTERFESSSPKRITGFSIKVEREQTSPRKAARHAKTPGKKIKSPAPVPEVENEESDADDSSSQPEAVSSSEPSVEVLSQDEIQKIKVQVMYPKTSSASSTQKEVTLSAKRNLTIIPIVPMNSDKISQDQIVEMPVPMPRTKKGRKDPAYLSRTLPSKVTSREELQMWVSLLCPICYEVQSSGYALEDHRKKHNENIPCNICSRQFNTLESLLRHSVCHHKEGDPLICPLCAREDFTDHARLQTHVRTCTTAGLNQPEIKCPWCGMCIRHISHMHQHQEICNGTLPVKIDISPPDIVNGLTRCDICQRVIHPSSYAVHRYKHANHSLLNCRVCGRGFSGAGHRERHERKHPSFDEEQAKESLMELIKSYLPPKSEWPEQWTSDTTSAALDYTEASMITNTDVEEPGLSAEGTIEGDDGEGDAETEEDVGLDAEAGEANHNDEALKEKDVPEVVIPTMEEISEQVYNKLKEEGKIDLSLEDWMTHFQTTGSKLCEICGKVFKTSGERKIHLMTHLNIRPYACTLCDKKFVTLQQMTRHRELHTAECNIKCSHCDKKFRTRLQMARHRQTHYFEKNPLECPICHKFFRGPRILKLHQAIHKGGKFRQWQCDICSKWFHQQYVLAIHRNLVHKIEGPVEGDSVSTEDVDPEEVIKQEVEKRKLKKSDVSGEVVEEMNGVEDNDGEPKSKRKKVNVPRKHFNLYMCNICDKKMASYSAMKVHLMQHNGIRPFQCPHCPDKTFITRQNLQKHIMCCHEMTGSIQCEICGRTVKEHYYDRHMEKHSRTGYRPVPCTECDMRFYDHRTLKRHMQIHTKVSPNLCDLCGQSLSNPYQLKMHKKRHLGQLDHVCNICGRGFVNKTVLQQHQWVHTRDRPKPYVCQICSRAFCTRRVLNGHTKREHGITLGRYVCNHCHKDFGDEKPAYIQHVAQCNHEKKLREKAGYTSTPATLPAATVTQIGEPIGTTITIPNTEGLIETEEATVVIAPENIQMPGLDRPQVIEAQEIDHEALLAHLQQQQQGGQPIQEIQIIQAEEEVVEEQGSDEAVQYVFVDADGNVLETIEGTAGDFVVKTEDVDGQEHVVTYTVAGRGEAGEEVFAPVTVVDQEIQ